MTEQELSTIYNQIKGITIKVEKLNKDNPKEEFNRINRRKRRFSKRNI